MVPTSLAGKAARIAVVLDHRMEAEMVCHLLSSQGWLDVTIASGRVAGLEGELEQHPPDVVLITPSLPDGSGIRWAGEYKTRHPEARIVFLAHERNEHDILAAIAAGADGYIVDDTSCERLVAVISHVSEGGCSFDASAVESLLRQMADSYCTGGCDTPSQALSLSDREREIALLSIKGLTNKQIAAQAFVSVNTVKSHLRRIYQRLGVSSRRELRKYQWELNRQEAVLSRCSTTITRSGPSDSPAVGETSGGGAYDNQNVKAPGGHAERDAAARAR